MKRTTITLQEPLYKVLCQVQARFIRACNVGVSFSEILTFVLISGLENIDWKADWTTEGIPVSISDENAKRMINNINAA